ncbi:superoxide dismutase [Tissierella carlieri]|jgi:Fe-Mn family superoxide dismutase|uniref:Superoxide dismutase n=1 Tax=Tissierella carlieri TaxID=689904 RepID=A0ABT1S8Q1_9FIRM|nr:superoxide dismutase [Tissierella carlieri]MBU5312444.1 superoxide dismutase [Tissierella carlieri]MCQ4922851.1 superoxide dismutase [Tissierella carlieri]MDU5081060.1 superoxide dismutase [Bacillota bacterium]
MKFLLPELKYSYDALEPHIDHLTMETHHSKHHQTYVDNLNKALEGHEKFQEMKIEDILKSLDDLPENIKTAVRNNGGGHYNHTLFWDMMSPNGGGKPEGELGKKIDEELGGFDKLKEDFKKAALGQFGSGWAWLVLDNGKLAILSTPNQDNPISQGKIPLLGIDVWEHAYYLKYKNKRADYIDSWWNVVDWNKIEEIYNKAK